MRLDSPFVLWLTTNPVFTWLVRHVFAPLDPMLFKATNGRFTVAGPAIVPMVTVTAIGRRSGARRAVHLACLERADGRYVVASAMGQARHPDWRYNLEANPEVEVQARGERYAATAELLTDAEKAAVWDEMTQAIPQLRVYAGRTDRNIRVFRLRRRTAHLRGAARQRDPP